MTPLGAHHRQVLGGALLTLAGALAALRAATTLHIGSPADMGPGFFPLVLGIVLLACGAALALSALRTGAPASLAPKVHLRTVLMVCAAVAAFALLVRPLGLIPAAVALVILAGFADRRSRLSMILPLAAGLSVISWLIFLVGLKMPIPAFAF